MNLPTQKIAVIYFQIAVGIAVIIASSVVIGYKWRAMHEDKAKCVVVSKTALLIQTAATEISTNRSQDI